LAVLFIMEIAADNFCQDSARRLINVLFRSILVWIKIHYHVFGWY